MNRCLQLLTFLFCIVHAVGSDAFLHDFDANGIDERIVVRDGIHEIQQYRSKSESWEKADFSLPENVVLVHPDGSDAGLRFVDLNQDGFDDILFSNAERYAIHLWTKDVQPHLGWTRGWTQFVRSGERVGAVNEPPDLSDRVVHSSGNLLKVGRTNAEGLFVVEEEVLFGKLIAFEIEEALSPEKALEEFHVTEGFRVELVASEPVVIDPVAFDWSADGNLWVAEMRDYPSGMDGRDSPGGVIKLVVDDDGDGRYDRAVPFIEQIGFPSGLMPWRNGLLISAAPNVLYAEDTTGDGLADVQRVVLTGFKPGNQQHRVNGFELGLDGWVYGANGDSGGLVRSVMTGEVVNIRGRDFRFRPDTGELETVSAQSQYGRRRDDWGNWFGNNNPTWLWHVTLPERYLLRNPKLAVRSVKKVLANYEDSTRVFPISKALVRPNQPWSINHVTSACSPTPYRDSLFGAEFATSVFISEPVHNAVHREVLSPEGGTFKSHRAPTENGSEFLASSDNWFRPTTTKVGPDGALYVADMYRLSIEHPEWISPEMQARIDLRAGSDRGRIYRVVPMEDERRRIPNLADLSDDELARAMNSPNGWQRDTVQRLLIERQGRSSRAVLEQLLRPSVGPQVRVQSLATIGALQVLEEVHLIAALADPHYAVRCEALRQSEWLTNSSSALTTAILGLTGDSDDRVQLQLAFTLGEWPYEISRPALTELAARAAKDSLLRIAVMSSLPPGSELFERMNGSNREVAIGPSAVALKPSSPDRAKIVAQYEAAGQLKGNIVRGKEQFQLLCAICHRANGEGNEVGPDLDMASAKGDAWLVAAILDPSQAVEARYLPWTVELDSGDELSGIVTAEAANNLVLRVAGGIDRTVLRSEIESMRQETLSLMPSGFESALTQQGMADLLAWLKTN